MTSPKWRHNSYFWSFITSWLISKTTNWPNHATSDDQDTKN